MTTQELFDRAVAESKSKNDTIMILATDGGLDVMSAVREYTKLAKDRGIVLSIEARKAKIKEILDECEAEDIASLKGRRELVKDFSVRFDISASTAQGHIADYAVAESIELETVNRHDFNEIVGFVDQANSNGQDKDTIISGLAETFGYSEKSATSAYSRAARELGLTAKRGGSGVALADLVASCIRHEGLEKKAFAETLSAELGYAESTAATYMNYIAFAKEYAKQMSATKAPGNGETDWTDTAPATENASSAFANV